MHENDAALDNPIWAALSGPQARFAEVRGRAARFQPDFSPFAGIADAGAWTDLAALSPPGTDVAVSGPFIDPPPGWERTFALDGVQMVGDGLPGEPDPEAVVLTTDDVPEILDLVGRTQPGPFRKRTIEVGRYLGIRRDGALVAMAGERLRVPGFTEISAICTDPAYQGQGLAARLTRAVAAGIRAEGDVPFLAVVATNTRAIRLYQHLGFTRRADVTFAGFRTPRPA